MAEEFEDRDLRGAVFWGVVLRDARLRDVDLTGTRSQHLLLRDVELDGLVDRLVVNGVDVTDHVHANDPWMPLRGMLEPDTADGIREAWAETERVWSRLVDRAAGLPEVQRRTRIDDEWSFVETLRHLVFAIDKWCTVPLRGARFSPIGLPNSASADLDWPGRNPDADPTWDEVLTVREHQHAEVRAALNDLDDERLGDTVEVLENGTVTVKQCWHVVLEEAFEHRRYAIRDLDHLTT